MTRPTLLCLNFEALCVHRYVPNQYHPGFASVEEWTVKDRLQFFESITPVTIETLRREG